MQTHASSIQTAKLHSIAGAQINTFSSVYKTKLTEPHPQTSSQLATVATATNDFLTSKKKKKKKPSSGALVDNLELGTDHFPPIVKRGRRSRQPRCCDYYVLLSSAATTRERRSAKRGHSSVLRTCASLAQHVGLLLGRQSVHRPLHIRSRQRRSVVHGDTVSVLSDIRRLGPSWPFPVGDATLLLSLRCFLLFFAF